MIVMRDLFASLRSVFLGTVAVFATVAPLAAASNMILPVPVVTIYPATRSRTIIWSITILPAIPRLRTAA